MTNDKSQLLIFLGLGIVLATVIAVPLTYQAATRTSIRPIKTTLNTIAVTPKINTKGDQAFGSLSATSATGVDPATISARPMAASGLGGGGGLPVPSAEVQENGVVSDKMASTIAIGEPYPYPGDIIQYKYVYTGDELNLADVSDGVYRQNLGLDLGNLGGGLTRANLGVVDLSSFNGLDLQSFSLKQADINGYTLYVDPANGMVSISGNEGVWAYPNNEYTPLGEDQVMADPELIQVANNFLSQYKIDTKNYGSPVVDNRGLVYALSQPASVRYIPEVTTITYPLLLDGEPAYGSDGSAYGLFVTVNMRTKLVASVNINVASSYDKSGYELERDAGKILSLAEQGGLYNYPFEGATKTITIELGTPEVILMNYYNYTGTTSESLFIPALKFPITKNDDTNPVYSDNVIVPLVKSVIAQTNQPILYKTLDAPIAE